MSEGSYCADCGTGTKNPKLRDTGAGAVEVCNSCHRDYEREYNNDVAYSEKTGYNSRLKSPQDRARNTSRRPGV